MSGSLGISVDGGKISCMALDVQNVDLCNSFSVIVWDRCENLGV